jgi:hypothetical protein
VSIAVYALEVFERPPYVERLNRSLITGLRVITACSGRARAPPLRLAVNWREPILLRRVREATACAAYAWSSAERHTQPPRASVS